MAGHAATTAWKTGSFNLIPSFIVMTLGIAGIGALPYYLRRLMYGEYPRAKDDFEKYEAFQRSWDRGAPFAATRAFRADGARGELEAAWQAEWKKALH